MNKILSVCLLAFLTLLPDKSHGDEQASFSTQLHTQARMLEQFPTFAYPFEGIVNYLKSNGKVTFPLFSYGSLMDKASAGRTLSLKAQETRKPALAFGLKRIFNKDPGYGKTSVVYGTPLNPEARAFLNVERSDNLESFINGVVIDVPIEDIEALVKREVGYDLIPVIIGDWKAMTEGQMKFTVAYVLSVPVDSHYISHTVWPRALYYQLCRDAAKQYGPMFEAVWFQNTFMANGQPIAEWEKYARENDPRTQIQSK